MKVFDYQLKNKDFKGVLKVELPSYQERINLLKEMNIKNDIKEGNTTELLDRAGEVEKLVSKHVKEIKLTFTPTKYKIDSIEDLGYFKEGCELINELSESILSGVQLGNV